MAAKIKPIALALLTTLGLAGCGGGGGGSSSDGGTNVDPVSSAGFASDESTFEPSTASQTFTSQSSNILAVRVRSDVSVEPANIRITFNEDQSSVFLSFGGVGYELPRFEETDNYSAVQSGGALARFGAEGTSENGFARIAKISGNSDYIGSSAIVVYGFDTNPDTVAALTGDVVTGASDYRGTVLAHYAPLFAINPDGASGNVNLTADFATNTVSGGMTITALGSEQGSTNWILDTTQITGNGFTGTMSSGGNVVDDDTTVVSANYDGRFYGTEGDVIGGQFLIELVDDGEQAFIQGGYIADEE